MQTFLKDSLISKVMACFHITPLQLVFFMLFANPIFADSYVAIDLNPSGFNSSQAAAIFDDQQVGVGVDITQSTNGHALLWNGSDINVVDLNPSGFDSSFTTGTFDGQHCGYGEIDSKLHALLWNGSRNNATDLHPSNFLQSSALDIFNNQQVGWGSTATNPPNRHALLWKGSADSVVDLHPNGFKESFAFNISQDQQVGAGIDVTTGVFHAVLWTGSADSAIDLHPNGFSESGAYDISSGQQVGYGVNNSTGTKHALLWKGTADSFVNLHPGGFKESTAFGVFNGQQVGYGVDAATGVNHALLWKSSSENVIDLNSVLPVGFTNATARAISANGDVVGEASGPITNGEPHAILWKRSVSSTDLISNVTAFSGRNYEVSYDLGSDSQVYIDRTYRFSTVPGLLQGATYIQTANEDKFERSDAFLSFNVNTSVTVYVIHDDRHGIRPSWLDDFNDTGKDAVVEVKPSNGQSEYFTYSVFAKDYAAGAVLLGGNYPDQDVGSNSMYSIAVLPQEFEVSQLSATSGRPYQVSYGRGWDWGGPGPFGLQKSAKIYTDRNYLFSEIPNRLTYATYIQTPNEDKFQPEQEELLTFHINRPATVYVLYDDRYEDLYPNWLSTFWNTGKKVRWTDSEGFEVTMSVFARDFAAGEVKLDGNRPVGANGNYSMYSIALVERELRISDLKRLDDSSEQAYSYVPWGLNGGARVYSDREYVYGEVPRLLHNSGHILTANDDKFSQDWRKLISFRANKPITLYIAHDDRYPSRPDWLSDFRDIGLDVYLEDNTRFSLFRKDYAPGYVSLQGNFRDGGNNAMYTIFVVDQADGAIQCTPGPNDAFPVKNSIANWVDTDRDGLDDKWEQALAEFYRPIMRFDSEEGYWPTSARWFTQHSSLTTSVSSFTDHVFYSLSWKPLAKDIYNLYDLTVLSREDLELNPSRVLSAHLEGMTYEPFDYPLLPSDLMFSEPALTSTTLYRKCDKGTCTTVEASPYHIDLDNDDPDAQRGEAAIPGTDNPDIEKLPMIPLYSVVHQLLYDPLKVPGFDSTGLYRIHYEYGFAYNHVDLGNHEGDWERLEVFVDPAVDVCQESGRADWLQGIKYYRHSCSVLVWRENVYAPFSNPRLPDSDKIKVLSNTDFPFEDGIPKVFVERNQHGFWSEAKFSEYNCGPVKRNANGNGPNVRIEKVINLGERKERIIRLSGETPEEAEDRDITLFYNGYFGKDHSENGPLYIFYEPTSVAAPGTRIPASTPDDIGVGRF